MNVKDATVINGKNGSPGYFRALSLFAVVCLLLFVLLFHPLLKVMWERWKIEDFNYCYFIPLIVLYLFWERRAELRSVAVGPSWVGIAPLLLGTALFWVGKLSGNFYCIYIASWFVLTGCVWCAVGWRWLKRAAFPLLFMISMFPFPSLINYNLGLQLKLLSSSLGVKMLQMCGMSVFREGNVIDFGAAQLQVADACSGIRYFYPLVLLATLLAYHFKAPCWKKSLLVLSAAPLSVISNAIRIAFVVVLYHFWGEEVALGLFHDLSGWFIFMLSLGLMLLQARLLRMAFSRPVQENPKLSIVSPSVIFPGLKVFLPQFIAVTLLLFANVILSHGIDYRQHKTPLQRPLNRFPMQVSDWRGAAVAMEKTSRDALKFNDYVMIHYTDSRGREIDFYTAYYDSQGKGNSVHLPADCYPGNGWEFTESGVAVVPLGKEKAELRVRRAKAGKEGERELIYYWFPQRGRDLISPYQLNFYLFWDALTRRRTDGALVRIITPLYASEQIADAEARLRGFTREIAPVLEQFLPR